MKRTKRGSETASEANQTSDHMKTLGKKTNSVDAVFHLLPANFDLFSIFHQLFHKSFPTTHEVSHISQTGICCGMTLDSGVG